MPLRSEEADPLGGLAGITSSLRIGHGEGPASFRLKLDGTYLRGADGTYAYQAPRRLLADKLQCFLFIALHMLCCALIAVSTWKLASGFGANIDTPAGFVFFWFMLLVLGGIGNSLVNYIWPLEAASHPNPVYAWLSLLAEHFGGTMASLAVGYGLTIFDWNVPERLSDQWYPVRLALPLLAGGALLLVLSTFLLRRRCASIGHQLEVTSLVLAPGSQVEIELRSARQQRIDPLLEAQRQST